MSIIKEKIKFDGRNMNFKFSLSSNDNFIGFQQEIDSLMQSTTTDLINPAVDAEEKRFKLNSTPNANLTLIFQFYNVTASISQILFTAAGFTTDEINSKSLNLLNSFFILDFYDTYNINTQTKIFTTYLTKIGNTPQYTINETSNNQLYRWYVPISYLTGTTMTGYVKFSFYNAKTGKITTFFNVDNTSLTTPEHMFFKAQLDQSNMTWKFLTTSYPIITANEISNNTLFTDKVNNTIDNMDNLKQNPPSGDTFIISNGSAGYGSIAKNSSTQPTAPILGKLIITSIVSNNAVGNSSVISDGGADVNERGFVWSTSPIPTTDNNIITSDNGTGAFTANLWELNYATTYYARAYAINNIDITYSNEVSFTTLPVALTVLTDIVGTVISNSATLQGHVGNDGGAAITAEGFIMGSNPSYLTINISAVLAPVNSVFYGSASPLAPNTTYYYKACATNSVGTSYGSITNFTTTSVPPPSVTTIYFGHTSSTATIKTGVNYTGSDSIIDSGIVWATHSNPDQSSNNIHHGAMSGGGYFDTTISGLSTSLTYHVRSYIIMGSAPSSPIYGNEVSFILT